MQAFEDESPQEATKKVANTWARTLMPANIKQIIDAWPGRNRSYITINGSPASTVRATFFQSTNVYMYPVNCS
jgi:hypothetical protein